MSAPTTSVTSADLPQIVGRTLGPTRWHDLTQADVDAFTTLTRQGQWIHTDVEAAGVGPFAGTIAPATMVAALLPGLATELLDVTDAALTLTHAIDDMRFPATLPVGTALQATATVTDVGDVPGGRSVTMDLRVERDAGIEPVGVATLTLRYYL